MGGGGGGGKGDDRERRGRGGRMTLWRHVGCVAFTCDLLFLLRRLGARRPTFRESSQTRSPSSALLTRVVFSKRGSPSSVCVLPATATTSACASHRSQTALATVRAEWRKVHRQATPTRSPITLPSIRVPHLRECTPVRICPSPATPPLYVCRTSTYCLPAACCTRRPDILCLGRRIRPHAGRSTTARAYIQRSARFHHRYR